jgi:hypothetical protein
MLKNMEKNFTTKAPRHKVSPRKAVFNLVHSWCLGALVVRTFRQLAIRGVEE